MAWHDPRRIEEDGGLDAIAELRARSLRYVVAFVGVAYFLWHTWLTATWPFEVAVKAWTLFPLAVGGALATSRLTSRAHRLAGSVFVLWALGSVTATAWLFESTEALMLYPVVALAAVVLVHPRAGAVVVLAVAALLGGGWLLAPEGLLTPTRIAVVVLAAAASVMVAWVSAQSLGTAVAWSLVSYEEARRNMREAQDHRGQLVQALKQLDVAYYRLQQANGALATAWRAAEQAQRAKTEFATNISHELRTPLNLIVGFSEMMMSAPKAYDGQQLPREYRGDLHAIYRSAQHLLALTDDVLDLAQAEVNRLVLVREPTEAADVVLGAMAIVRDYIEAKGLALRVTVQDDLPPVRLDALRIRQVLLNLLTNAARHTERGEIAVTVARHGREVLFAVADTGPGIAPREQARLFEEFHHVDDLAARSHASTGVGLSLSKKFVELHRGRMWVESATGAGATFYFGLPLEPAAGDAPEGGRRRGHEPPAPPAERILVLSDVDPGLEHLVRRRLGADRIVSAPDPERAAELARDLRAAAIVVGLDAPAPPDCPTTVIRCALPHHEQVTRALGVAGYLVKPVGRAALHAAIERLSVDVRRILVVDDDPRAVRLLQRMLRAGGRAYQVVAAHNGREALETMRASRPDLVLLDLTMPIQSGEEVLGVMAGEPALAGIPVIVVSARGPEGDSPWLPGEFRVSKEEGLRVPEVMDLIEAVLTAVRPPRAYLTATEREPAADQAGSPA
jgi:signal transduction histidine kinase/CheY-like chemotaxis protein